MNDIPNGCTIHDLSLWIDGFSTIDRKDKTAYLATNITYGAHKHRGKDMVFNGSTSYILCGDDRIGVGDRTFVMWLNPTGWGGSDSGLLFSSGTCIATLFKAATCVLFSSDTGGTFANSGAGSIAIGAEHFISITRTAAGVANIYINNVVLGGSNQATGTPASATNNTFIGGASGALTFDGSINNFRIFNKILTPSEIGWMYSNEK